MSTRDLPDWRAGALCAQIGGDMFFPPKGGSDRSAKIICAMCDVRIQCLKWDATAVLGDIRVTLVDEGRHDLVHLGDVTGRPRLVGRRQDTDRKSVV